MLEVKKDTLADNAVSNAMFDLDSVEKRRTNIAIYGLIFVVMVSLGRIQEIIPGLAVLKLGKMSFGLAFLLYFVTPKQSDVNVFSSPQMKYVLGLFLLGFISTPFSYWPAKSFNFMIFQFFSQLVLLFLLVKIARTAADLNKIAWGIVVSMTFLGIMALMSGGARVSTSSTYDPNDLALVLVIFLPLFCLMLKNKHGGPRILLMASLVITLMAIMATQSRGGFIGMVTVLLGVAIKEKMNLVKMVLVGGVIMLAFSNFAPDGYGERISTIFSPGEDYNMTGSAGRIEIWKRGLKLMAENPLLGVGPAAFEVAEGAKHAEGDAGKWSAAHNSFVQIATELGITGLILFMMMLVTSIRSLRGLLQELPADCELRWLVNSLELGFYGYVTSGFFLSQAYASVLFLLVGLTIAVVRQAERYCRPKQELTRGWA